MDLTEFEKVMVGIPVSEFVETRPSAVECGKCHKKFCVKYSMKEKYGSSYYYQCQSCKAFAIENQDNWALDWYTA